MLGEQVSDIVSTTIAPKTANYSPASLRHSVHVEKDGTNGLKARLNKDYESDL